MIALSFGIHVLAVLRFVRYHVEERCVVTEVSGISNLFLQILQVIESTVNTANDQCANGVWVMLLSTF